MVLTFKILIKYSIPLLLVFLWFFFWRGKTLLESLGAVLFILSLNLFVFLIIRVFYKNNY